MRNVLLCLILTACSTTYGGAARLTHANNTCSPQILVDLDFAATLALFTGSALAYNAGHTVRGTIEAGAAIGIVFGSSILETTCVKR